MTAGYKKSFDIATPADFIEWMLVSMIAAMGKNRVLAGPDGIPWNMPRDKKHLRNYTAGKPMLLGRITYEEMQGWFTEQIPVVLTSNECYPAAHVVHDLDGAIQCVENLGAEELVVAGGASVYALALPRADRLVLTFIDHEFPGQVFFPEWDNESWEISEETAFPPNASHAYPMRITILERKKDAADGGL